MERLVNCSCAVHVFVVQSLLVCNPQRRMGAEDAMQQLYFADLNAAVRQG